MTRQLISTVRQPPLHYLTRSVRRTSGFVLADHPGVGPTAMQADLRSSEPTESVADAKEPRGSEESVSNYGET